MTTAPRIALVTARAARDLDDDLVPLEAALRAAGAEVAVVDWDDPAADWSRFDLAVLRSTWDYTGRLPEFLAWAARAAARTTLLNPLQVVRWNTDKHYLGELARAGVPVVPSAFVEPGEDAVAALESFLAAHADAAEFVVKPCVGAGSRDAQRYGRGQRDAAAAHARRLLDAGRSVLLQPYLERVDEHGETALLFFDGTFSHAIRKAPLLQRDQGPTRALFAAERIAPRTPGAEEHAAAARVLQALPFGPLLYARVDLLHDADGRPRLLELELTEPSLFFAQAPGSVERYAAAILRRCTAPRAAASA
ncbi:MAG: hypothetical protein ABFC67_07125 [Mizugakiibacter sp.]|uniref:ATP-grasp domain-containing protein n=1 Tax=Mizugakiibacter sp. TaxID=1972610 RepID=UPI0031C225F9|nr:hypothetical protein [Xanthomonadaceae bacterium]